MKLGGTGGPYAEPFERWLYGECDPWGSIVLSGDGPARSPMVVQRHCLT
jgi:hypothetical protein